MMDNIKAGMEPMAAIEKASGKSGVVGISAQPLDYSACQRQRARGDIRP